LIVAKTLPKMEFDPDVLMRIFTIIPVFLVLVAGAAVLWAYFFVLSLLPAGESLVEIPGLTADVRVFRDANGIPSIIGEQEQDVATVLGYVMAQDRLWQMDYLRKAGQGRLAEILGPDFLDGDHLMRAIKVSTRVKEYPGNLRENEKKWLESFVNGINRYVSVHEKKLPVEFSFLEYRPEPFSPNDIGDICLAFAWDSSSAVRIDPIMTQILARLGKDRAMEVWPVDSAAFTGFVSVELVGWEPQGLLFPRSGAGLVFGRVPGFRGGCLWSVGPTRSRSGKPMTCSSVYQSLSAPGFWYKANLRAGEFYSSGAFIPGIPAALAGANRHSSWGAISSSADDADLFIEKLDSKGVGNYWRIDRWNKVEELKQIYRVRGGSSIGRTVRLTETGPLVTDSYQNAAMSLRWTAQDGLSLIPVLLRLNRAANGSEVKSALKQLIAPCLDVVWADDQGNWGIQSAGRMPIRSSYSDGIVPQPAWTGVHDWLGYIPFNELPAITNPSSGLAVKAGDRPGGSHYPYFVSCYWDEMGRAPRIMQFLEHNQELDRDIFEKLQNDCFSPLARDLTPILLKALNGKSRKTPMDRDALRMLSSWDFQMSKESPAAAVFGLFYRSLLENLVRSSLSDSLYKGFGSNFSLGTRLVRKIFIQDQKQWLEGIDPEQILLTSFEKGITRGKRLMGSEADKWTWGKIHAAEFIHPLGVRSRFMESLYQVGPVPVSGSVDAINFAGGAPSEFLKIVEGVSLRQISDITGPPQVFAASPMGISAHFFSGHYKDQMRVWADGRLFQYSVHFADAQKEDSSAVLFKPARVGQISMGD
jgi:penicillin G amidase